MTSKMNISMAPVLTDYHQKSKSSREKILRNETERIELDQKLRSLLTLDSRLKQHEHNDQIQAHLNQLDQDAQRAKQRNTQLLNDVMKAEGHLNELRINAERVIRLRHDYIHYLESNYPDWQKGLANTNVPAYDLDRLNKQENVTTTHHEHHTGNSSLLSKHSEARRNSYELNDRHDDPSMSESTSNNTFSRSKFNGSLRMELTRTGLYFLFDYIEKELIESIDKKKFYQHDPPTITQKRSILTIANEQQHNKLKDLDLLTTTMFILDQLSSTIRRTTIHQCLLTDEILSLNIIDLNKDKITNILPEQDRSLWIRLIDHFTKLLKYHVMNSDVLANKFASTLLPNNSIYLQDKAKSLLKHLLEKNLSTQQLNIDDDTSTETQQQQQQQQIIKPNPAVSSAWLNRVQTGGGFGDSDDSDDDDDESDNVLSSRKNIKSASSAATTPRGNVNQDDSDFDFYS